MGNKAVRVFLLLLLILIPAGAYLYFNQEKIIFYPEKIEANYKYTFAEKFEEENLQLSNGQSINYLVFNPESTKGTILYFHGNAGSLASWGVVGAELAKHSGWSVWMMDYPGYGKSSGPLPKNEQILLEMGRALRDKIIKDRPGIPLVFFGRSIGSGIASTLAAEHQVSGLILEAPFKSLAKLAKDRFKIIPEKLVRFDLDNEKKIPLTGFTPVIVIHGADDKVVPFSHGESLRGLKPQVLFVGFNGLGHDDLATSPEYWPNLKNFFDSINVK